MSFARQLAILLLLLSGAVSAAEEGRPIKNTIDVNAAEEIELSSILRWCVADPEFEVSEVDDGKCNFQSINNKNELYKGLSRNAYWLTFTLENSSASPAQRYLRVGHPRLQSVILHTRRTDQGWERMKSGILVPARDRPILTETPTFPISIGAKETQTFYVRIASETAIDISAALLSASSLSKVDILSRLMLYFSLGASALSFFFCLVVYGYIRDLSLLYFAGTLISMMINDAGYTGSISTFLWSTGYVYQINYQAITVLSALTFFTLLVNSFIPKNPLLNAIKNAIFSLLLCLALLSAWAVFVSYQDTLIVFTLVSGGIIVSLVILISAALCLKKSPPILLVWTLLPALIIVAIRMMSVLGVPTPKFLYVSGFSWIFVIVSPIIISGMVRQAEAQKQRLSELALDARIRSQFLAHMSHDFRSPLSTIIRYADLVERGSERVLSSEAMAAIKQNSYDLLFMIDDILDYIRRDVADVELSRSDTQFDTFLEGISTRARYLCKLTGNSFEMDLTGTMPTIVRIDKARLGQVLNNFISNANRYTENGNIYFRCDSKPIDHDRCQITFSVRDTGMGIEPIDQKSIFEPHIRGKNARSSGIEGFGIGLALAKTIVGKMGSDIKLESYPGKGTTFSFTITCDAVWQMKHDELSPLKAGHRPTLLLVDDDPADLVYLCDLLAPYDVEILTAASGNEARQCWQDSINLVITDQFMVNGDGWDVLEQASRRNIPAIMISAAEPRRPDNLGASLSFVAVFCKPFEDRALIDVIDRLVGGLMRTARCLPKQSMTDVSRRPAVALLAPLQKMIEEGAVTAIENWLLEVEQKYPDHQEFWSQLRVAHRKLDFEGLQWLIER